MAYTLLNVVNKLLTRVREQDSRGVLTTLTDSSRQPKIDRAVQSWNEALMLLYTKISEPMPNISRRGTITLEEDVTLYNLPDGFIHLYWPLRHAATATQEADGHRIRQYAPEDGDAGFARLWNENRFPDVTEGRPQYGVITPDDKRLLLDRMPTSAEAGDVYEFQYSIQRYLEADGDTFPCNDATVDALLPVAAELWRGDYQNAVNSAVVSTFLGEAARRLNPNPPRKHW